MLRPGIWESQQIKEVDDFEFRVYIGLISHADDEGRLRANPVLLAGKIFPYSQDVDMPRRIMHAVVHMENLRDEKDKKPLIGVYQNGDDAYIFHPNWKAHQHINHPTASNLPKPPNAYAKHRALVTAYGYRLNGCGDTQEALPE